MLSNVIMDLVYTLLHIVGDPFNFMSGYEFNRTSGLVNDIGKDKQWILTYDGSQKWRFARNSEMSSKALRYKENGVVFRLSNHAHSDRDHDEAMKAGSLLGMGILNWNSKIFPDGEGKYRTLRKGEDRKKIDWQTGIDANAWTGHNLTLKLTTMGIIGVSSVVGYYGIKYVRHRYRR